MAPLKSLTSFDRRTIDVSNTDQSTVSTATIVTGIVLAILGCFVVGILTYAAYTVYSKRRDGKERRQSELEEQSHAKELQVVPSPAEEEETFLIFKHGSKHYTNATEHDLGPDVIVTGPAEHMSDAPLLAQSNENDSGDELERCSFDNTRSRAIQLQPPVDTALQYPPASDDVSPSSTQLQILEATTPEKTAQTIDPSSDSLTEPLASISFAKRSSSIGAVKAETTTPAKPTPILRAVSRYSIVPRATSDSSPSIPPQPLPSRHPYNNNLRLSIPHNMTPPPLPDRSTGATLPSDASQHKTPSRPKGHKRAVSTGSMISLAAPQPPPKAMRHQSILVQSSITSPLMAAPLPTPYRGRSSSDTPPIKTVYESHRIPTREASIANDKKKLRPLSRLRASNEAIVTTSAPQVPTLQAVPSKARRPSRSSFSTSSFMKIPLFARPPAPQGEPVERSFTPDTSLQMFKHHTSKAARDQDPSRLARGLDPNYEFPMTPDQIGMRGGRQTMLGHVRTASLGLDAMSQVSVEAPSATRTGTKRKSESRQLV